MFFQSDSTTSCHSTDGQLMHIDLPEAGDVQSRHWSAVYIRVDRWPREPQDVGNVRRQAGQSAARRKTSLDRLPVVYFCKIKSNYNYRWLAGWSEHVGDILTDAAECWMATTLTASMMNPCRKSGKRTFISYMSRILTWLTECTTQVQQHHYYITLRYHTHGSMLCTM